MHSLVFLLLIESGDHLGSLEGIVHNSSRLNVDSALNAAIAASFSEGSGDWELKIDKKRKKKIRLSVKGADRFKGERALLIAKINQFRCELSEFVISDLPLEMESKLSSQFSGKLKFAIQFEGEIVKAQTIKSSGSGTAGKAKDSAVCKLLKRSVL